MPPAESSAGDLRVALEQYAADMEFHELRAIERRQEEQECAGTRPRTPVTVEALNFAWGHVYVRDQLRLAGLLAEMLPSQRPPCLADTPRSTVDQLNGALYLAYSGQQACRDAADTLLHPHVRIGSFTVSDHAAARPHSPARLRRIARDAARAGSTTVAAEVAE